VVEKLLGKGASIDLRSICGGTALIFASRNGHRNVVEKLAHHNTRYTDWPALAP
jgi:ankyrin repeat protein